MSFETRLNGLREIAIFDNRWELLINRLFFRKTTLTVHRLGNLEFIVEHQAGDANGVRNVIASGMYRELLPKCLWDCDVSVLDLGANAGGFPLLLLSLGICIRKLVCVEMNPRTFQRLEFNVRRNCNCSVTCINAAVCGETRTIPLAFGMGATSDSIYHDSDVVPTQSTRRCSVKGLLFDDIYQEAYQDSDIIDLCKIDVEQAEYEIFLNQGHEALKKCRYLLIEIHNVNSAGKTNALLTEIENLQFIKIGARERDDVFLFENRGLRRDQTGV